MPSTASTLAGEIFTGYFSFDDGVPNLTAAAPLRGDYTFGDLSQGDLVFDLNGDTIFASETLADGRVPDHACGFRVENDQA